MMYILLLNLASFTSIVYCYNHDIRDLFYIISLGLYTISLFMSLAFI